MREDLDEPGEFARSESLAPEAWRSSAVKARIWSLPKGAPESPGPMNTRAETRPG